MFFGVPNYHCMRIHNEVKTWSLFTMFITSNTDEHNIARILQKSNARSPLGRRQLATVSAKIFELRLGTE